MDSVETVVVGQVEMLRCALRVSPLRVPLMEGVVDTEEEGHSDPAGEPEGDKVARALLVMDWEDVADTEELLVEEPVIECAADAEAPTLNVKMEGVIMGEALASADNVDDTEAEAVAVDVAEDEEDALAEAVGDAVAVALAEALAVAEADAVAKAEAVLAGVCVAAADAVEHIEGVREGVGVPVGVADGVEEGVPVGDGVEVCDGLAA